MRSTILFLSLLLVVSCMKTEYDQMLLEFSNDPKAEAVFATMAIQLKQEGGFERVLSLLTSLVEDARKQLHENTMKWKKVHTACEVDEMTLREKQDYFEGVISRMKDRATESQDDKTQSEGALASRTSAQATYAKFKGEEQARSETEIASLNLKVSALDDAVSKAEEAISAVEAWGQQKQPETASVQEKLEAVATAYLQTHSYKLYIPSSFVQTAADDKSVRQRLFEWLSSLKLTFLEAKQQWSSILERRQKLFAEIQEELTGVDADLLKRIENLKNTIASSEQALASLESRRKNHEENAQKNKEIMVARKEYCNVEDTNFNKVKTSVDEQITLFREVRDYFRTNYAKISKVIKKKYNA